MAKRDGDPGTRRRIIERPRLLRLLDETDARIILLVAPAGYGKTTLARQWLAKSSHPAAWYRASAGSADPAALATGLAEAAKGVVRRRASRLRGRLLAANAPPPDPSELARLLADDLLAWPPNAWFAIDDHQILASSAGEVFIGELVAASTPRFLITSRRRPTWLTTRMLLYGEARELAREELAFTSQEADEVMANRATGEAAEVYERSAGWPAIIGLAALTSERAPAHAAVPGAVHDFFAEEIFSELPEATQRDLLTISPAPSLSPDLLRHLIGSRVETTMSRAVEAGLLSATEGRDFDLHPLLRSFLLRKLEENDQIQYQAAVMRIAEFLMQSERWDDVAFMIKTFSLSELWDTLIDEALRDYLAVGRLAALADWVDHAARAGVDTPVLDVAKSELTFRCADYATSERCALRALRNLDARNTLLSDAWFRAGQAAHFQDDHERAAEHYEKALAGAQSIDEKRQALWGLFNLAAETESLQAAEYLAAFEDIAPLDQTSRIRVAGARLALAIRAGGLRPPLDDALRARPIVGAVSDPVARSGFLNALAHGLVIAARYAEAHEVAAAELADARLHRLHFVLPHAHLLRSAANLGLRRFQAAHRDVAAVQIDPADAHVFINRLVLQAKIALAVGDHGRALKWVLRDSAHPPNSAMHGEFLAMRSLVYACAKDAHAARALAEEARATTRTLEAMSLADWADAIATADLEGDAQPLLAALDRSASTGSADSFVVAYRGRPSVLHMIFAADPTRWSTVQDVLRRANDLKLSPCPDDRLAARIAALSRREQDVYALLGKSYSNRDIAQELFISESTVKVHVRRILKKLNVRSRTEAAVLHATSEPYRDD